MRLSAISDICTGSVIVSRSSLSHLPFAGKAGLASRKVAAFGRHTAYLFAMEKYCFTKGMTDTRKSDLLGVTGEVGLFVGLDVGLALGEVDGLLLGELDTPGPGEVLCPEDTPGEGLHPQRIHERQ